MLPALNTSYEAIPPRSLQRRARGIFTEHQRQIFLRTDRMFAVLMAIQWVGGIILSLSFSQRTWAGETSAIHVHVWSAIVVGALLSGLPIWMAWRQPGTAATRYLIAVCQMLWSALLIHLTGGRIETHFHIFGSLAFLAFYRDWRVLIPATAVVTADHMLRGIFWPESVYGVLFASPWRSIEHAAWVIFEDVFLLLSCRQATREMWTIAEKQARLEHTRDHIEVEVRERTSELVRVNKSLEEAEAAARASALAKSEFLANMSHEIRTPMTAILGFAEMLLDKSLDSNEREDSVLTIHRNGRYLLEIIDDILDLSKIEAGKMTVECTPCDIDEIVADVHDLICVRSDTKGLRFEVERRNEPPKQIRTDPTRLRQILINLLGNAIKFTTEGEVRLIVDYDTSAEPPQLLFDVVDTGIGMSASQAARLFVPFNQADMSTTRRFGGTGLGLTISKRFAEMLDGDVRIISTSPGEGTRMRLQINCVDASVTPVSVKPRETAEEPIRHAKAESHSPPLDCRVLLAEDGFDNQKLINRILTRAGASVVVVENGQLAVLEAITAIEQDRAYDVILMDMQMPVMDGYEATKSLRRRGYERPIVALTANAMKGDAEICMACGCDLYLTKPIDRARLVATIRQFSAAACPVRLA
ncbi:MAG: ATP-binding protein [Phycisphaerae bacterium]